MKATGCFAILLVTLLLASFRPAAGMPTVPVGNPGNPDDTTGFGGVGHTYHIGKYEVTNAQYVEFLNGVDPTGVNPLGLYDTGMSDIYHGGIDFNFFAVNGSKYSVKVGGDSKPVTYVSWYDAIRFANWLHNGQGSGDTENGAYTLVSRPPVPSPVPSNGDNIKRNSGARWWIPSEDEWYKAAYHKNDGVTGNYWDYPTSSDAHPYSDQPPGSDAPDPSNTANFDKRDGIANGYDDGYAVSGSESFDITRNYITDVGAYALSTSPYGTFDQGGNVWEWNEALISSNFRGRRGASWFSQPPTGGSLAASSGRGGGQPAFESQDVGFRVATIAIPEPSAIYFVLSIVTLMLPRRLPMAAVGR